MIAAYFMMVFYNITRHHKAYMLRGAPPITPQCGFPNRKVAFCGFPNGKIANFRHLYPLFCQKTSTFRHLYPLFCQKTSIFGLVDSQTAYFGQIVDSQIGFWTNFQKWGVNDLEIPENLNMYALTSFFRLIFAETWPKKFPKICLPGCSSGNILTKNLPTLLTFYFILLLFYLSFSLKRAQKISKNMFAGIFFRDQKHLTKQFLAP